MDAIKFGETASSFYEVLLDNLYTYSSGELCKISPSVGYIKDYNRQSCILLKLLISTSRYVTFTVSFHPLYSVPICHFKICDIVGQIESNVPDFVHESVQYEEHPIFQDIWMTVHPCETADFMKDFKTDTALGYLENWFNLYGIPCVFPEISLRTVCQFNAPVGGAHDG